MLDIVASFTCQVVACEHQLYKLSDGSSLVLVIVVDAHVVFAGPNANFMRDVSI